MARNYWIQTTSVEIALVAATVKTVLQITSPSSVIQAIQAISISFDGTVVTAEPVLVQLVRQTTAGTGTARNPLKTKDTTTGLGVTGAENFSVEPALGDIMGTWEIHPQSGQTYPLTLPDGEIQVPASGRIGLRATAPANVNCVGSLSGEE